MDGVLGWWSVRRALNSYMIMFCVDVGVVCVCICMCVCGYIMCANT